MRPRQQLTGEQKRRVEAAKTGVSRYHQTRTAASEEVTDLLIEALAAGVSKHRLAQEVGLSTQAINGRLHRRSNRQNQAG